MRQVSTQDHFKTAVGSGKRIYELAKELNIDELEKQLPEYTEIIEQYFLGLDREKLSIKDIESIKYVMSTHEKIVNLIDKEKEQLSVNLKQLHTGKEMKNTYPQTAS